jgi:hypothetical protein
VVYNLVAFTLKRRRRGEEKLASERPPITTGILGGLMVTVMGNLEGFFEVLHARGVLPESFWTWLDIPGLAQSPVINSWYPGEIFMWWWRASRVLADKDFLGQNMGVQPIDEFPFFSLLGDNHRMSWRCPSCSWRSPWRSTCSCARWTRGVLYDETLRTF